jgi:DNA repair protein SbcD/Mre11
LRLVLFSDLHLDAPFAWFGGDQQVSRRRRQALRDTLLKIMRLSEEVSADALLCGGDLYEQDRFTPDTGKFLRDAFAGIRPIPVYLSPGNHDWFGPTSIYNQVDWSDNVHVFKDDQLEPVTLVDGLTLWGAAHRAPANTDGFLDSFQVNRGGIHIALFHGSERSWLSEQGEGKTPHAPFWPAQIEQAGLHHAFLGHFHRPRDAEHYTYPGNPDPLTFGEDGLRGAVVATIEENGAVHRVRHDVATTQCHDLELDVSGCASQQDVRERLAAATSGLRGFARVTLTGELEVDVDLRLRDLEQTVPGLDAITVRAGRLHSGYDFDAIAAEPTVRGQFVQDVRAAAMAQDQRHRVLVTGLRALSGRDDLEVP